MLGNSAVLALNSESTGNRQVSMVGSSIVWTAQIKAETKQVDAGGAGVAGLGQDNAGVYVAMFNAGTASSSVISVSLDTIGIKGASKVKCGMCGMERKRSRLSSLTASSK